MSALVEMYVQGVSTRKVKAVTEELCGHSFSASTVSQATARLDEALKAFYERRLAEPYPYLILDARYERAREAGVIASQAVLVAIRVDWEGRRQVLGVELANRESHSSWREFVAGLKQRGLAGVEFVVSDDHPGLRAAIREVLPEAVWQRCYVHFLRNALDYVPRKVDDDCLMELRWFYDRSDLAEVKRDLAQWIAKWQAKYPKLVNWVEDSIEETLSFYRLPLAHHKHMKSTNMLERLNQEIKRRTLVVRIFPSQQSCLRLVRALAGGDPRELARGDPLPQYGSFARAQEGEPEGIGRLRRGRHVRRSAKHGGCAADPPTSPLNATPFFAELDAHNSSREQTLASAGVPSSAGRVSPEGDSACAPWRRHAPFPPA